MLAPLPPFAVLPEFFQLRCNKENLQQVLLAFTGGALSSCSCIAHRRSCQPLPTIAPPPANSPAPLSTAHNIFAPAIPQLKVIKSTRRVGFRSRGQATAAVSQHAYPLNQINKHYELLFKFLLAFSGFHTCRFGTAHAFHRT